LLNRHLQRFRVLLLLEEELRFELERREKLGQLDQGWLVLGLKIEATGL
jgi:hypothetical protein